MKKIAMILLALLLVLGIPLTVAAEEQTTCRIEADSVTAKPGDTVTVPIRISDNPGFTNFAIRLNYDRENLTLLRLETKDGENAYLCGTHVSTNPAWTDADDQTTTYGYIVCAHKEAVKEDGVLFTAVFQVNDTIEKSATLTPQVQYIRNQTAQIALFETIQAETQPGTVSTTLTGDVNFDGRVTPADALKVYKASIGGLELNDLQKSVADVNSDGKITPSDALKIYKIGLGDAQ